MSLLCPELIGRAAEVACCASGSTRWPRAAAAWSGWSPRRARARRAWRAATAEAAAARGCPVLTGRAVPGANPVPYRALVEAFLGAFRSAPVPDSPELAGLGGHLGRLVPGLAGRPRRPAAEDSPLLLAEAVVRLLRAHGDGRGCVLVVEDLHWADPETLAALDYLGDALPTEPVLCVATARPEGDAAELLERLERRDPAAIVRIAPLAEDDVDRMVAACLATPTPARRAHRLRARPRRRHPVPRRGAARGPGRGGHAAARGRGVGARRASSRPRCPRACASRSRRRIGAARRDGPAGDRRRGDAGPPVRLGAAAGHRRRRRARGRRRAAGRRRRADRRGRRRPASSSATRSPARPCWTTCSRRSDGGWPDGRGPRSNGRTPASRAPPASWPRSWRRRRARPAQAAERLVESARRALAAGALATAEGTARRARRLAPADEPVALRGRRDAGAGARRRGQARRGARARPRAAPPAGRRPSATDLLVGLAHAALTAGDVAAAERDVAAARAAARRRGTGRHAAARLDAVAAAVALDQVRLDEAVRLGRAALAAAERADQPEVQCEALEVLGRAERGRTGIVRRRGRIRARRRDRRAARARPRGTCGPATSSPSSPGPTAASRRCAPPATSRPATARCSPWR